MSSTRVGSQRPKSRIAPLHARTPAGREQKQKIAIISSLNTTGPVQYTQRVRKPAPLHKPPVGQVKRQEARYKSPVSASDDQLQHTIDEATHSSNYSFSQSPDHQQHSLCSSSQTESCASPASHHSHPDEEDSDQLSGGLNCSNPSGSVVSLTSSVRSFSMDTGDIRPSTPSQSQSEFQSESNAATRVGSSLQVSSPYPEHSTCASPTSPPSVSSSQPHTPTPPLSQASHTHTTGIDASTGNETDTVEGLDRTVDTAETEARENKGDEEEGGTGGTEPQSTAAVSVYCLVYCIGSSLSLIFIGVFSVF